MNLERRLERLESILKHKGKPSYEEYQAACKRLQDSTRGLIEYRIAKARGEPATEPITDQQQDEIDQDIIRAYEGDLVEDNKPILTERINRLAEKTGNK
jgi:hypothetical protein